MATNNEGFQLDGTEELSERTSGASKTTLSCHHAHNPPSRRSSLHYGSTPWPIPSPNELRIIATREECNGVSVSGEIRYSSVAPLLTFEKKVMVTVRKFITDLGVGDPERVTAEELNPVLCKVAIFTEEPKKRLLNMIVRGWCHLVRAFPSHTVETSTLTLDRRSWMLGSELLAGEFSKTTATGLGHPLSSSSISFTGYVSFGFSVRCYLLVR